MGSRDPLTSAQTEHRRPPLPLPRKTIYKAGKDDAAVSLEETKSRVEVWPATGTLPRKTPRLENRTGEAGRKVCTSARRTSLSPEQLSVAHVIPDQSTERPIVTISDSRVPQRDVNPPPTPPRDWLPTTPGKWVIPARRRKERRSITPERSPVPSPSPPPLLDLLELPVTPGKWVMPSKSAFVKRYQ